MATFSDPAKPSLWSVGALCRAVADALDARFNPVAVAGEISNVVRAASGHLYFSLKDDGGQLRCAMFRRAASALGFTPKEGDRVELRGRISVYEPRGDLQLVVESMVRAGQGTLFEQFLALKAKLDAEGLFEAQRKRSIPALPSRIGLVTSLGAAALHDVSTALQRRLPHVLVVLSPASVQGATAPMEIIRALHALYALAESGGTQVALDAILLVRGGGSLEDLWAFNDEELARTIARSPVPVITGIGHETDFTIADFVADLRAPTPTAAAELAGTARQTLGEQLDDLQSALSQGVARRLEREAQRIDLLASQIVRPGLGIGSRDNQLQGLAHRLVNAVNRGTHAERLDLARLQGDLPAQAQRQMEKRRHRLEHADVRLRALDPRQVLQRGYAWLTSANGSAITRAAQLKTGEQVRATLADGAVDMTVRGTAAD